jgi:hypothetical protein
MHGNTLKVLFIGDVMSTPGRSMLIKHVTGLKKQYAIDVCIANGENAAFDGRGLTPKIKEHMHECGVDVITTGNHVWAKKELVAFFASVPTPNTLLRPINYPAGCPGTGVTIFTVGMTKVGIINVAGRVFLKDMVTCPFRALESALTFVRSQTDIVIVDMHAETSAEKRAVAHYFDGNVSLFCGTHTHVPTADEQVLPGGTAYITDVGMCGPRDGIIGMRPDIITQHFLTQMPNKFMVQLQGSYQLQAVVCGIDVDTGKALSIERIQVIDTKPTVYQKGELPE